MTEKIDLYKELKEEYKAKPEPAVVKTSKAQYLSIEGKGDPNSSAFQEAIGALYAMAFTIKMTRKAEGLGDYVICKLESQWFSDKNECFANLPKEKWQWIIMIRTPDCVKKADLTKAVKAIESKGKCEHPVDKVELIKIDEGPCAQTLHVGPYEKVGETIDKMVKFIEAEDYTVTGRYHEIYLSDPRRIPPERLKTIVRFPVAKK